MRFQKIGISDPVLRVKWMKYAKNNLAVLTRNSFFVYNNIEENLDDPEFQMNIDENLKIVDFCFSRSN